MHNDVFSTPPIRVAFDLTELGAVHSNPRLKRGINRVVENVLERLLQSPEIELGFTATQALHGARLLHAADSSLAARPLLRSRYQEAMGWMTYQMQNYSDRTLAKRAAWRRGVRFGLARAVQLLRSQEARLPPPLLASYDIFHSLYSAIPGTLRRLPRLQKFQTIYDLIPVLDPSLGNAPPLRRILASIRPDDWLLCISQSVKNDACEYLGHDPSRVFVTPLAASQELFYPCRDAADVERARARYGIPAGRNYILSLSALDMRKNLRHLIRCFRRLEAAGEIPDLCLVLVGKENPSDVAKLRQEFAADPAGGAKLILTGYVADADLAALYSGATLFAFPSLAEGFGLPPLEAMQCGVPVISSNATSLPEVVGDAGLLLDPTDIDGWCAGITRLCKDDALRASFSRQGIARAQQFSWQHCADLTVNAYRTAIASR